MRLVREVRLWMMENWFRKRVRRLQHQQATEHQKILEDLRASRQGILHNLADEVLRLQAVTDCLEQTLDEMKSREEDNA